MNSPNNPIIPITDFASSKLDVYARFTEGQLSRDPALGLFIAESPLVIGRALDAGYEPVSLLLEEGRLNEVTANLLNRMPDVPVYTASEVVLKQLTGFALTRGALCAMKRKPIPSVSEVCRDARRLVLLENVMNPTNVGAIFRSAAALHMDAVILTSGSSDPLYRRSSRVSMGNVFSIPWTILPKESGWPTEAFKELSSSGFKVAAMALNDRSLSVDDPLLQKEEKLAILLGTEGEGLSDEAIAAADYVVKIPMDHGVDSLNVAAASAVAFWEFGRANRHKKPALKKDSNHLRKEK